MHHGAEHVLAAHQASIEKGQARAGHHEDQGRTYKHPGVIAGIDLSWGGRIGGGHGARETKQEHKSSEGMATGHDPMIVYGTAEVVAECSMGWIGNFYSGGHAS